MRSDRKENETWLHLTRRKCETVSPDICLLSKLAKVQTNETGRRPNRKETKYGSCARTENLNTSVTQCWMFWSTFVSGIDARSDSNSFCIFYLSSNYIPHFILIRAKTSYSFLQHLTLQLSPHQSISVLGITDDNLDSTDIFPSSTIKRQLPTNVQFSRSLYFPWPTSKVK